MIASTRTQGHDVADAGFSLIEVLVSFTILLFVAGGATMAIVGSLQSSHLSQQRVDAANVAQQDISQTIAAYQSGTMPRAASYTSSVKNEDFSVTRTVAFVGSATACTPGASFTVHVSVDQKQTSAFLASSDTVIAC